MNLSHTVNVSTLALKLGFKQVFANKLVLLGSFGVYAVIMMLYGGVINMIPPEDIAPFGLTNAQMIWYMGMTELILFSIIFHVYKEVQEDIRSEQIYLSLLRPYSPAFLRIAMWCGEGAARLMIFTPLYFIYMYILAGSVELSVLKACGILLGIPLGVFLLASIIYLCGVSCLWIMQSEIAFFILFKSIFLFGAMMWPIVIYPELLQYAAWATPFPATLSTSASWALSMSLGEHAWTVLHQIFWAVAAALFMVWLDNKVLKTIQKGEA